MENICSIDWDIFWYIGSSRGNFGCSFTCCVDSTSLHNKYFNFKSVKFNLPDYVFKAISC